MALEDFREGSFEVSTAFTPKGTYTWYANAYGFTDTIYTSEDFGTGFTNTGTMIEIWNKNGEGEGSYSGATQDDHDIFKHIQDKYAEGWYIPSKEEWAAFADYLATKADNPLTTSNYNNMYGLSDFYSSSSQYYENFIRVIIFRDYRIDHDSVAEVHFVRLGITF